MYVFLSVCECVCVYRRVLVIRLINRGPQTTDIGKCSLVVYRELEWQLWSPQDKNCDVAVASKMSSWKTQMEPEKRSCVQRKSCSK